jgi:DNA-directed RNA polymerase subunit RPC12/RpoP
VVTAPLTETVPVTGSVALVDTYVCIGCGNEVTDTLPEIGRVAEVDTYTFHGVVYCETLIDVLTIETGKVALVTTYACMGCGMDVTETLPVTGSVALVETYTFHGTVPWYDVTALTETATGS